MSGCSAGAGARRPKRPWLGWIVLLGALAGLVIFAATFGHRRQAEEMRHLLFAITALPSAQVSTCLMQRLPLEGRWLPGEGAPQRIGAWNAQRDLMVEVMDIGAKGRRIEISSRGGRMLRDTEGEALRRCLAGA